MLKGIYYSAYGLNYLSNKQDVLANNMANVNTLGFKKQGIFARQLAELENQRQNMPRWEDRKLEEVTITNYDEGNFRMTENPLDIAIKGDGFFTLQTFSGLAYTRNGSFKINPDGILVNDQNQPVLGENGVIVLEGNEVAIGEDGQVVVDGNFVDRLRIVDFEKPYRLSRIGDSLLKEKEPFSVQKQSSAKLVQGCVEDSNVKVVEEMVDMLETFRHFESGQKVITATDETLDQLINQVGRLT